MRKKRLLYNTISSLTYQILAVICGFILPRLILRQYGSAVNGLVNSITQFLSIIAFLELGVGTVVQSSLYKPLALNSVEDISRIISSAEKFFKRIAYILIAYVAILMIVYPYFVINEFGWAYTALLILAMSISSFAQYYIGIVDRLLLNADQHGYIQIISQIITLVANTLASVILIYSGASIQVVKLISSILFLIRPLVIRAYVNGKYHINRKISYSVEPIKQKWNGIAQHVAAVILDGTDTIVLTLLSTLQNVSIYSVYHLVVYGVKQLFLSMFGGFQSLIGELWAKQELENLNSLFEKVEWVIHTSVTFVFTCVGLLIIPFVQVYTAGVHDAEYIQPLFAVLITAANAGHCLRLPYNIMILAAGHYKQTQSNYIIATVINIVVSILTVFYFGLVGVAIGTLMAMMYQAIWMAYYNSKHLLNWPFKRFLKQLIVDVAIVIVSSLLCHYIAFEDISYIGWVFLAVRKTLIVMAVSLIFNIVIYKRMAVSIFQNIKRRVN